MGLGPRNGCNALRWKTLSGGDLGRRRPRGAAGPRTGARLIMPVAKMPTRTRRLLGGLALRGRRMIPLSVTGRIDVETIKEEAKVKNFAWYGSVVLIAALLTMGCATADVAPSVKIGAYYDLPAKASGKITENATERFIDITVPRWSIGGSIKATFRDTGPVIEPCVGGSYSSESQRLPGALQDATYSKLAVPAEVCVEVDTGSSRR